MDDAVKVLKVFSDVHRIRILKLLAKKMLDSGQMSEVLGITSKEVDGHITALMDVGVVKKIPGGAKQQYFAVAESSIFNRYAKDTVQMLNRWFNSHPDIIKDHEKVSKMK